MEILGRIKRLYSRNKKSRHEIAKTTGLSHNTIRKWVRDTPEAGGQAKLLGVKTSPPNSGRVTRRWCWPVVVDVGLAPYSAPKLSAID